MPTPRPVPVRRTVVIDPDNLDRALGRIALELRGYWRVIDLGHVYAPAPTAVPPVFMTESGTPYVVWRSVCVTRAWPVTPEEFASVIVPDVVYIERLVDGRRVPGEMLPEEARAFFESQYASLLPFLRRAPYGRHEVGPRRVCWSTDAYDGRGQLIDRLHFIGEKLPERETCFTA